MSVALTVIVKDENGNLLNNADVTVAPGDFTAKTNENGEAALNIEGANRYQVTVSAGESEQTVPYYDTGKPNAKLEVNLQYFKQLNEVKGETTDSGSTPWYQTDVAYAGYAVAFVIVLAVIVKVVMSKRNASRHARRSTRATTTSQPTSAQESTAVEDVASELEKESKTAKTKKSKKSSK